jgi:hypothetical protein
VTVEAVGTYRVEETGMAESGIQQIIIGVIIGAVPALASQWISGWWGLKHRKVEIYLSNKAASYAALFGAVHELLVSPRDELKYAAYRSAFERAKMFASDNVRIVLEGDKKPQPDTLSHSIELIRRSEDQNQELHTRIHELHRAMSRLSDACRRDFEILGLRL